MFPPVAAAEGAGGAPQRGEARGPAHPVAGRLAGSPSNNWDDRRSITQLA